MKFKDFLKNKGLDETSFASKEANEQGVLMSEFNDIIASKNEEALKALKTKNEQLENALKEQGSALTELKASKSENQGFSTLKEALNNALAPHEATLKSWFVDNQKQREPIQVKVAVVVGEDNTIGAGSTQYQLQQNTGIVSTIRKRVTQYLANVSVGQIGSANAIWTEEKDEQGNIIFIGEGDTKTQTSVRYEEASMKVKKVAAHVKVSTELMADLPQFITYIESNLMKRLDIATEDGLFSGDGTGDNLKGILEYATAFSAGTEAGTIDEPNIYDVIDTVGTQVEEAFGVPNVIFLHPRDVSKLRKLKATNGEYLIPTYLPDALVSINGMKVVKTTAVSSGTFVGGDLTAVHVLIREELGLQIGLDGTDFTKNQKTILAEKRLVQFVSANDTQVIVKGDFATAITALTKI
jgi:HK97 family phage major capsid protein